MRQAKWISRLLLRKLQTVSRTCLDCGKTVVVVVVAAEEAELVAVGLQVRHPPEHRAQDEVAPQALLPQPALLRPEPQVQGAAARALLPVELPQQVLPPERRVAVVVALALLLLTLPVYPTPHLAMPAAASREACPSSRGLLS
jgi:hypothetical protein